MRNVFISIFAFGFVFALAALAEAPAGGHVHGADAAKAPTTQPEKSAMMTPEKEAKCQLKMKSTLNAADPGAVLGFKDELKLTADQVRRLEAIAERARADAKAVLTDEQLKDVVTRADVLAAAAQKEAGAAAKPAGMGCEMMKKTAAATQPTQVGSTADPHAGHH